MGGNGGGRFAGPSARKIKQFILIKEPGPLDGTGFLCLSQHRFHPAICQYLVTAVCWMNTVF